MQISAVLRAKGSVVATAPPDSSVAGLLAALVNSSVGAVVVVQNEAVLGMVWERELIRLLHERGAALLEAPASEVMNIEVVGCAPTDELDDILRIMTDRRIRHLPVMADGRLCGLVSMGDLVKARIGELESDRAFLQSYITAG